MCTSNGPMNSRAAKRRVIPFVAPSLAPFERLLGNTVSVDTALRIACLRIRATFEMKPRRPEAKMDKLARLGYPGVLAAAALCCAVARGEPAAAEARGPRGPGPEAVAPESHRRAMKGIERTSRPS